MRQTFWCVLPKLIAMIGSSLLFVLMPLYVLGLGGSLGQTLQSVLCSSTVLALPGLLGIAVTLAYRLDVSDEGLILREPWRTRWIVWNQIASVERGSDHQTRIVSARPVDVAGLLHSRHAGGPRDTRVDIDDVVGDSRQRRCSSDWPGAAGFGPARSAQFRDTA